MQREKHSSFFEVIPEPQLYAESPLDIADALDDAGLSGDLINCLDSLLALHETKFLSNFEKSLASNPKQCPNGESHMLEMDIASVNLEIALDHLVSELWEDRIEQRRCEILKQKEEVPVVRILKPLGIFSQNSQNGLTSLNADNTRSENQFLLPEIKLLASGSENKSIQNLESEKSLLKFSQNGTNEETKNLSKKGSEDIEIGLSPSQQSGFPNEDYSKKETNPEMRATECYLHVKRNFQEKRPSQRKKSKNVKNWDKFLNQASSQRVVNQFVNNKSNLNRKRKPKSQKHTKSDFKFGKMSNLKTPLKLAVQRKSPQKRKKMKQAVPGRKKDPYKLDSMKSLYRMLPDQSSRKVGLERRPTKYSFEESRYSNNPSQEISRRQILEIEKELKRKDRELREREQILNMMQREQQNKQETLENLHNLNNLEDLKEHLKTLKSSDSKISKMKNTLGSSEDRCYFFRSDELNVDQMEGDMYEHEESDYEGYPQADLKESEYVDPNLMGRLSKGIHMFREDISMEAESKTNLNNLIQRRQENEMAQILKSDVPHSDNLEAIIRDEFRLAQSYAPKIKRNPTRFRKKGFSPDSTFDRKYQEDLGPNQMNRQYIESGFGDQMLLSTGPQVEILFLFCKIF